MRAVAVVRAELEPLGGAERLAQLIEPLLPDLVARITEQIQDTVAPYGGMPGGRRRRLINMAVNGAIRHFVALARDPGASGQGVDDLFRRMGYGDAIDGTGAEAMVASLDVARQRAWDQLHDFCAQYDLSARLLGALTNMMSAYMDHLADQAALGYRSGLESLEDSRAGRRAALMELLLEGAPSPRTRTAATEAVWPLPEWLGAIVIGRVTDAEPPDLSGLEDRCLVRSTAEPAIVLCRWEDIGQVVAEVTALTDVWVAHSWAVPPHQVRDAVRWCQRAIDLVEAGTIEVSGVIDCREHRTQLWLHSEPALRQRMCQDLLQPLLAETPNSREILSETLLVWLETRDSAPAIASRLGVHPQTVRYRWKRINELFGEVLHDPEFIVQITMLLKASVPLWKAGDQSDFERYRAEAR